MNLYGKFVKKRWKYLMTRPQMTKRENDILFIDEISLLIIPLL